MNEEEGKNLTPAQQSMVELWGKHTTAKFQKYDVEATRPTTTPDPHVIHVPVMAGRAGLGARALQQNFISGLHSYNEILLVSRTIGLNQIVDELVYKFGHAIETPWMLPGVRATGKHVEVPVVTIVEFQDEDSQRAYLLGSSLGAGLAWYDEER
jgi:carboxymethylenebutenolidase